MHAVAKVLSTALACIGVAVSLCREVFVFMLGAGIVGGRQSSTGCATRVISFGVRRAAKLGQRFALQPSGQLDRPRAVSLCWPARPLSSRLCIIRRFRPQ